MSKSAYLPVSVSISARSAADAARGYDVLSGRRVLASYATLEEAQAHARRSARYYVRYWGVKEGKA